MACFSLDFHGFWRSDMLRRGIRATSSRASCDMRPEVAGCAEHGAIGRDDKAPRRRRRAASPTASGEFEET